MKNNHDIEDKKVKFFSPASAILVGFMVAGMSMMPFNFLLFFNETIYFIFGIISTLTTLLTAIGIIIIVKILRKKNNYLYKSDAVVEKRLFRMAFGMISIVFTLIVLFVAFLLLIFVVLSLLGTIDVPFNQFFPTLWLIICNFSIVAIGGLLFVLIVFLKFRKHFADR